MATGVVRACECAVCGSGLEHVATSGKCDHWTSVIEHLFYEVLLPLRVRGRQVWRFRYQPPCSLLARESTKFLRVSTISGSGSRTSMG